MRRTLATIGATLAVVSALAATTATAQEDASVNPGTPQVVGSAYEDYVDRDWPGDRTHDLDSDLQGDETQDPDGGGLGGDWEDDWFEDYEESAAPTGANWIPLQNPAGGPYFGRLDVDASSD